MANNLMIIVLVVVVIAAAAVYVYYADDSVGAPEIRVIPSSYDFGEIPKEEMSREFEVKNTGTSVLEIKKVSTSCGCTKAEIDSDRIDPGQSANLLVTFDPNAMDEIEENVFRIVYIKSNDPVRPEVEIEIRAKVIGGKNV